ncbi:hypothetical protein Drorol1_Dr00019311 [Drosera rotundifolia]
MASKTKKLHAICIPYPAQGHIIPMMKLAKLLQTMGFHIMFVHTEHNHRHLLKSRGPETLDSLPSFKFVTIRVGLPRTDANVTQDIGALASSVQMNCLEPFKELVLRLNEEPAAASSSLRDQMLLPVTHIVSDSSMFFNLEASAELETRYLKSLELNLDVTDASYSTNGHLGKVMDWIPGMQGIILKGKPSFIKTTD